MRSKSTEYAMIEALVGEETAKTVVAHFRGQRRWVPQKANPFAELDIPAEAAARLHKYYAKSFVDFPMEPSLELDKRDEEIYKEWTKGAPINRLVKRFALSRRHIFRAIQAHKKMIQIQQKEEK